MSDDIGRTDEYLELIAEDQRRETAALTARPTTSRRHPSPTNHSTPARTTATKRATMMSRPHGNPSTSARG